MNSEYRTIAEEFVNALRTANPESTFDAILTGSVARGFRTPLSDIDVVVISDQKLGIPILENRIHLQKFTRENFLAKLQAGDDFTQWCVRYGEPLLQSELWNELQTHECVWPDWHEKVAQGVKQLIRSGHMLQIEDFEAGCEEMRFAARHLARSILFKEGIFPLSGPEMVGQLASLGKCHLSDLLAILNAGECDPSQLRMGKRLLKKSLVTLDRSKFAEVSIEYTKKRKLKRMRLSELKKLPA